MEIRKLGLEPDDRMTIARDVSSSARAHSASMRCFDHSFDDCRVSAHPEIVIGAPHHDLDRGIMVAPNRIGRPHCLSLEIGKHAVATFLANSVKIRLKMTA